MFGRKRIAELEGKLADLQKKYETLAGWHKALGLQANELNAATDANRGRYTGVNQEIGELRAWIKGIETRVGVLEDLYGGVAKSHVKEIKGIETRVGVLEDLYGGVAKSHVKEIKRVSDLQEQVIQAGRKKVRRRDPETGRFVWDYPEELDEQHNVSAAAADGITQKPGGPDR